MPTTITCRNLASFAGATNLQLFLRKSDNTLINTGGDTGASIGVGMFSWTVAETIPSEDVYARIYEGATEDVDTIVIDSILYHGHTEIGEENVSGGLTTGQENKLDSIAVALAGSAPVEPTGTTVFEHLEAIQAATDSIGTRPIEFLGNVADGGQLLLTVGDDHESVIGHDLPIKQKDPAQTLFSQLTAAGVTLQWAAGQGTTPNLITGTVTTPTHSNGVTTIIVQVPNTPSPPAPANIFAPFAWQLQRTIGGRRQRMLKGSLKLDPDMIGS